MTAYRLHAVLRQLITYSWHEVLMTAFDSILHVCSSIKSTESTQIEQCSFYIQYDLESGQLEDEEFID